MDYKHFFDHSDYSLEEIDIRARSVYVMSPCKAELRLFHHVAQRRGFPISH